MKLTKGYYLSGAILASLLATNPTIASSDKPGEGTTVRPIFPTIAEEHFQGYIAVRGLEELGYEVKTPEETEYATLFLALGSGDADFTVHGWDILHDTFYQKTGGDETMVKLGTMVPGVLQGYLIDKNTADKYGITSLDQFKDPEIAKIFDVNGDGKADLTGCNSGWGCEQVIEHQIKAYDLNKTVSHNQGSYFALIADTIARYKEGQPILYYTWAPQWVGGVLEVGKDVEWLSVAKTDLPDGNNDVNTSFNGKNLGFAVDKVKTIASLDFVNKNPAAAKFLSLVSVSVNDISIQNLKMRDGEKSARDIDRHVDEWIAANRSTFDKWLNEARNAVN
ncbi:glycine betaine/L-proline ABC transporter substrate-binding protein ProX [Kiloniella sp.]|uniref:glycine betaine/L-proline ABC transporter substrate-binding protein ProX n=1 Tax=Kiloniella sp. TaxID=1938587 RepID=UPI003B01F5AE